ncbi:MAG: TolC family outer membrane protein [Rickettsiales bacterium]
MYSGFKKIMMAVPASITAVILSAVPVFAVDTPPADPKPAPASTAPALVAPPKDSKTPAASPEIVVPSTGADSFSQALIATYQSNPRIKAQQKALTALDENVSQAHSGWLPSAEANYSNGRQRLRTNDQKWNYGNKETRGLTVVQPVFQGGETIAQTSRAENLVYAGREDLRNTEQQVLLDAITAYMDVLRDQSVLDLSRNNEEVLKKQLQASRERFDVGEVTKTDVAQSEARLSRADSDTIQALGSLRVSEANFERVVGHRPNNIMVPQSYPAVPRSLDEALKIGQDNSPTVKSASYRQLSTEDEVDINVARILPDINLRGSMSRDNDAGTNGDFDFDEDSVLMTVRVPLYQSGAEYSRIRQSKETASQRKFDLLNAKDENRQEVTQAWENLQTAIATIRSQQDSIRAAEVALDGVKQEHLYGTRTVLDVLDAEQELFVARVNLVRAERNRVVSLYTLLSAVGQLTLDNLGLRTTVYDPNDHYDDVKYQFIGF